MVATEVPAANNPKVRRILPFKLPVLAEGFGVGLGGSVFGNFGLELLKRTALKDLMALNLNMFSEKLIAIV